MAKRKDSLPRSEDFLEEPREDDPSVQAILEAVRGIRGMVERDAYCTDILTQISAVQSALSAVSRELLASHIRTCVVEDIRKGDTEVVDDLVATIQKMMK